MYIFLGILPAPATDLIFSTFTDISTDISFIYSFNIPYLCWLESNTITHFSLLPSIEVQIYSLNRLKNKLQDNYFPMNYNEFVQKYYIHDSVYCMSLACKLFYWHSSSCIHNDKNVFVLLGLNKEI